ncbi:phosphoglycerate mutase-like protein [Phellopilus nigrolimitatus]|nr:phosphoglycerate mutase-like protein [Phellopilus nigrolimitatus]
MLLFVLLLGFSRATKSKSDGVTTVTPPIRLPDNIKQSWAQYSPYFSVSEYAEPPDRCKITQVNIIQRHGARFPTSSAGLKIQSAVAKLQTVSHYMNPHFSFLKNYIYDLGHEDLVPFGAAQSYDSGQLDYSRYSDLVNKTNLPFVRASSSKRVVQSATNWTAGFAHASNGKAVPSLDLILRESLNDTLDDSMCPNAGDSDKYTDAWQSVYATPIAARLNAAAPDANLTVDDVSSLISLCPFDTLAKETPSAFCSLFNQSDFYGFEYLGDLSKYYGTGYGQALGPVQGVGYVNELLARLTDSPVRDNTQTNRTLDGDPATFPLGRGVYADFSHDNQMIAIYSALGLFRQPSALDPEQPDARRTWLASQLVPFSARLVTERLECGEGTFVRMLVDDALQNLEFCGAGKNGLCSLDAFVASQGYAASDGGGDFEKCFS